VIFLTWIKPSATEESLETIVIVKVEACPAILANDLRPEVQAAGSILVQVSEVK
jgi:hypothetical protein